MKKKFSEKQKDNIKKQVQKVFLDEIYNSEDCYIVRSQFGILKIISKPDEMRIIAVNKKSFLSYLFKYNKYNQFRIYRTTKTTVKDITYKMITDGEAGVALYLHKIIKRIGMLDFLFDQKNPLERPESINRILKEINYRIDYSFFYKKPFNLEDEQEISSFPSFMQKSPTIYSNILLKIKCLIFPLLDFDARNLLKLSPSHRKYFLYKDIRTILKKYFKSKIPKSIKKELFQNKKIDTKTIELFFLSRILLKIWDVNHVVKFLQQMQKDERLMLFKFCIEGRGVGKYSRQSLILWRKYFQQFSPQHFFNFISDGEKLNNSSFRIIRDSIEMMRTLYNENIKITNEDKLTISEFHDFLSFHHRKRTITNKPLLIYKNIYNKLFNEKVEDLTIDFPLTSEELFLWSKSFKNCVYSYRYKIEKGISIIFSLNKGEEKKYCVELLKTKNNKVQLTQCLKRYNGSSEDEIKIRIKQLIDKKINRKNKNKFKLSTFEWGEIEKIRKGNISYEKEKT